MGDRLWVGRRLVGGLVPYRHLGIDMGDGTVVHARPDDPRRVFGGGRVVRSSLGEFAEGEPVRIVAEPAAVFPPEEIVRRAEAHVGRDGYCPVIDNCEHFATWCATGVRRSRQVDRVLAWSARIVGLAAVVLVSRAVGPRSTVAGRSQSGALQ